MRFFKGNQRKEYHKPYIMQRIYAIVIFIITAAFTQAQITEVSLHSNPILQKHHAEKRLPIEMMLQKREAAMNWNAATTRDPFLALAQCIDQAFEICSDTIGLGGGSTVMLLDESALNFGTASASNPLCITYTPNAGITFGMDSVHIEICGATTGNCDTIIYPIFAHRPSETTTLPTTILNAEDTTTICVDLDLPTDFSSATILSNNTDLGEASPFGNCVFYEAQQFSGTDVVTFEVCDVFCICDVYELPFVIQQDTIELPFMDDFSYDGPYPNDNWLNNDVFVNNTMAIDPVSVGVATFDGINEAGTPYGGGFGSSDELTSAYLDLSPFTSSSNVFLSFYVQPEGLGEQPRGDDILILEFKNQADEWILIDEYKCDTDTTICQMPAGDQFTFFSYPITQSQYLYKGFQFRLRNFSGRSGNIDHWHVDYFRLASNVSDSPILEDIAFTEVPNPILKTYTSMPWWHFVADINGEIPEEDRFNEVHIYSHDDVPRAITPTEVELIELETGTVVLEDLDLFQSASNIQPGRLPQIFPTQPTPTFPTFSNSISNDFSNDLKFLAFEKTYSISVAAENESVNPIVKDNNIVSHTTVFDNYFAYDDGTAESGLEATTDEVQIALKFHANVGDTLKAVQFHFPHIKANTSNQSFNLKIWVGELDDTPEYEGLLQRPLYIDSYLDSLNAFTTYVLKDLNTGERTPLFIPAGDFYVGWQQIGVCALNECISVGLDKNNPDGMENVFFDAFGFGLAWQNVLTANQALTGSLMIRPIVGEGLPQQSSSVDDITNEPQLNIYPNPTDGFLNIRIENGTLEHFSYQLFDAVGKSIGSNSLSNQLNISHLQNGIYFIKIINHKTNHILNHKIILAK